MTETNKYIPMYFCTWCGCRGSQEDFDPLGNSWYDNVCRVCRQKEREGATMSSIMKE